MMRADMVDLELGLHMPTGRTGVGTQAEHDETESGPADGAVPPTHGVIRTGVFLLDGMPDAAAAGHELRTAGLRAVLHRVLHCAEPRGRAPSAHSLLG